MRIDPTPPLARSSCTIAAWILPALGALVVQYRIHLAQINPHGWLPGLNELVYGMLVLAAIGVGSSILAFVRREKWRWATTPIWLAGGAIIGWFALAILPH